MSKICPSQPRPSKALQGHAVPSELMNLTGDFEYFVLLLKKSKKSNILMYNGLMHVQEIKLLMTLKLTNRLQCLQNC
jgi:hypothetical protein